MTCKPPDYLPFANQDGISLFPRSFRWTIQSDVCTMLGNFAQKFSYNLAKRTLTLSVFEFLDPAGTNPILEHIHKLSDGLKETLVFTDYDGCGGKIDVTEFYNVTLIDHDCPYDYASSEVVQHTLTFSYEKSLHEHFYTSPVKPPELSPGNLV